MKGISYITDDKNKKIAVQIDLKKYGYWWEKLIKRKITNNKIQKLKFEERSFLKDTIIKPELTHNDIVDIAVIIVGELVGQGLVPDCTNTNDETEFLYQDAIYEVLSEIFNVEGEY